MIGFVSGRSSWSNADIRRNPSLEDSYTCTLTPFIFDTVAISIPPPHADVDIFLAYTVTLDPVSHLTQSASGESAIKIFGFDAMKEHTYVCNFIVHKKSFSN